ncbi:MAG: hypothetical protein HKO88_13290 [Xanthomonadales bacterium]|nr:hypothetical protein [Xanthomonadales bacterium]
MNRLIILALLLAANSSFSAEQNKVRKRAELHHAATFLQQLSFGVHLLSSV